MHIVAVRVHMRSVVLLTPGFLVKTVGGYLRLRQCIAFSFGWRKSPIKGPQIFLLVSRILQGSDDEYLPVFDEESFERLSRTQFRKLRYLFIPAKFIPVG
ncbi:hypothetical protein BGZ57DRAFT_887348 [Hyaloscypha finlandica]|nr:hypothetical protein BGZ57DRAFT_887348 [Hyaloscypha finlandica]